MFPDSASDTHRSVTGQTDSLTFPDDANFATPVKRKSASVSDVKQQVFNNANVFRTWPNSSKNV